MKRIMSVLCVLIFVISLLGCKSTISSSDDMLKTIAEQEHVTKTLQLIGSIEEGNSVLVAAMSGQLAQEQCYYTAEFYNNQDGTYTFIRMVPLTTCGWQNAFCKWGKGYIFLCNNDNASCLRVTIVPSDSEGSMQYINIDKTPWMYFYKLPDIDQGYQGEFVFLDGEGDEIA